MFRGKSRRSNRLLILIFLPGFILGIYRSYLRHLAENQDRFIETVMDFEELRKISREEGWSLGDMLSALVGKGASSVGISEDTLHTLESEGRVSILGISECIKLAGAGISAPFSENLKVEAGVLCIHSSDTALLDRVEKNLQIKISPGKTERIQQNFLLVRKSSVDFRERVGLGFSPEFIALAREKGLGIVLRVFNYPGLSADGIRRIINDLPPPEDVSAIIFAEEEVLGNRGKIETAIAGFLLRPYRLGWVELNDQGGMDKFLENLTGRVPFVKVHSIGRKEMDEVYNVSRATARWIRAVRDRRLKMLYIRCFFQDKKKLIDDLFSFNLEYLEGIVGKLKKAGFEIPRKPEERLAEPRHLVKAIPGIVLFFIGISLLTGVPLLVIMSRRRALNPNYVYFPVVLGTVSILVFPKEIFIAFTGLAGAISFSTLGCIWAMVRLEDDLNKTSGMGNYVLEGTLFFFRLVAPGIVGGILIAGIHSESLYLLKFQQFRGIKLAFIIPLIWIGFWALRRYGGAILGYFSKPLSVFDLFIGVAVLAGITLYMLRSGNVTFLKPSEMEDVARTWLENLLVARPRYKEFLIGYPAVLFFLFFRFRQGLSILPVLALFVEMGQVSMVNTFCHFHSPLSMAFIRGFNGLWSGLLIGFIGLFAYIFIGILACAAQKTQTGFMLGYFGFGNLGDELLWRTFVENARKIKPEYSWILLHKDGYLTNPPDGVKVVSRMAYLECLESLARAKFVVIPGGGVLQSATSGYSLLYYLAHLIFGRIFGARLLLPAQGFGPWFHPPGLAPRRGAPKTIAGGSPWGEVTSTIRKIKTPRIVGSLMAIGTRMVLDFTDYFSIRDTESGAFLLEIAGPGINPPVTADLAFLHETHSLGEPPASVSGTPLRGASPSGWTPAVESSSDAKSPEGLSIGVILRGSVGESFEIASKLKEWRLKSDSFRLVPISFQSGGDDLPWKNLADSVIPIETAELDRISHELLKVDILVSMRLHGCILSTMMGIPWIGLAYDPKVTAFAQKANWDFVLEPSGFNLEKFEGFLATIKENRVMLIDKLIKFAREQKVIAEADLRKCLSLLK